MTDDIVKSISDRYLELFEKVVGEPLEKQDYSEIEDRIKHNIEKDIN